MKNILLVGTGTIGEPLIGLIAENKDALGIDNVFFFKRTPLVDEVGKVEALIRKGAQLFTTKDRIDEFKSLGFTEAKNVEIAYEEAQVIIDCTPSGNSNWESIYSKLSTDKLFLAQGSEHGFGPFFVWGINNEILEENLNKILIASCNTHNMASVIKTFAIDSQETLEKANFVCMRRSNDVSQNEGYSPSPTVTEHKIEQYGTHHARDVAELFKQSDIELNLFSSAIQIPTQYMHTLWFNLEFSSDITYDKVIAKLDESVDLTSTEKLSSNKVFSFGRDHGYHGRILSHGVIVKKSISVENNTLTGFCFTPQDGNALLSSVAASLHKFNPSDWESKMKIFDKYIYKNI